MTELSEETEKEELVQKFEAKVGRHFRVRSPSCTNRIETSQPYGERPKLRTRGRARPFAQSVTEERAR